jgi:hypothetical protein
MKFEVCIIVDRRVGTKTSVDTKVGALPALTTTVVSFILFRLARVSCPRDLLSFLMLTQHYNDTTT